MFEKMAGQKWQSGAARITDVELSGVPLMQAYWRASPLAWKSFLTNICESFYKLCHCTIHSQINREHEKQITTGGDTWHVEIYMIIKIDYWSGKLSFSSLKQNPCCSFTTYLSPGASVFISTYQQSSIILVTHQRYNATHTSMANIQLTFVLKLLIPENHPGSISVYVLLKELLLCIIFPKISVVSLYQRLLHVIDEWSQMK